MTSRIPIKLGLSQPMPCSYIDAQQEQLLVTMDELCETPVYFEQLLAMGFRRSGDQIYRPHCPSCQKCQAVRVLADQFVPTKSQKRKLAYRNKHFSVQFSETIKPEYYSLYERYINQRHQDGAMYPPNRAQYDSFMACSWLPIVYIELWHQDSLIAVAVTDQLPNALSAIYTFFDPDYHKAGIGSIMIMEQIKRAQALAKSYVYLGFQIDECAKMNYKNQYKAQQILRFDHWQDN